MLADESIEAQIVERLRQRGRDVVYVAEISPRIDDDEVLRLANEDSRVLLTGDKDFGELVYRWRRAIVGVVLVRLDGCAPEGKAACVAAAVQEHHGCLRGSFAVVARGIVRVRRRPAVSTSPQAPEPN